jgi:hypothetical protein
MVSAVLPAIHPVSRRDWCRIEVPSVGQSDAPENRFEALVRSKRIHARIHCQVSGNLRFTRFAGVFELSERGLELAKADVDACHFKTSCRSIRWHGIKSSQQVARARRGSGPAAGVAEPAENPNGRPAASNFLEFGDRFAITLLARQNDPAYPSPGNVGRIEIDGLTAVVRGGSVVAREKGEVPEVAHHKSRERIDRMGPLERGLRFRETPLCFQDERVEEVDIRIAGLTCNGDRGLVRRARARTTNRAQSPVRSK